MFYLARPLPTSNTSGCEITTSNLELEHYEKYTIRMDRSWQYGKSNGDESTQSRF